MLYTYVRMLYVYNLRNVPTVIGSSRAQPVLLPANQHSLTADHYDWEFNVFITVNAGDGATPPSCGYWWHCCACALAS